MKTKWTIGILGFVLLGYCGTAFSEFDELAKFTASDGAANDYFGWSVSVSGDYTIVGALRDNSAYVFERSGSSWSQAAKLTASGSAKGDWFGRSVSISGNYVIIGAYGEDINGANSGSAYVFERSGSSWSQAAKLTASDSAAGDSFGNSVSISGDYAIVGAIGDDDNGNHTGSAYVFERSGSSWIQTAKITASDGAAEDFFGGSVSISGDYAIVGASADDDNGNLSGSAYIFEQSGSSWSQTAKLTASDGAIEDYFGHSVSVSSDYAIVGAYRDDDIGDSSGSAFGSAYIFERSGSSWSQTAKLTASDGAIEDYFGLSVSVSSDYAIVGAYGDDDNSVSSGSAYIFEHSGSSWSQTAKLTASDGAIEDYFGYSVSVSSDYAIVGAYGDDDNGVISGSAYVFEVPEPATPALLCIGGAAMLRRKKRG